MPRHSFSTEAFQMDLRSSPSQQQLNPSRSSSLPSQQEDMDQNQSNDIKAHKIDLYSIPVFLLEVLVLVGLSYGAYLAHFQYSIQPLISGFYCDDISYRQQFTETLTTKQFIKRENELTVLALLLALPITLIIFCELVNSMFGSLKFRQIRALCTCCKLHSITRRTFRFSGAYLLGFMIIMISCDILTTSTGRLRPYFAQDCNNAYQQCHSIHSLPPQQRQQGRDLPVLHSAPSISMPASIAQAAWQVGGAGSSSGPQPPNNTTNTGDAVAGLASGTVGNVTAAELNTDIKPDQAGRIGKRDTMGLTPSPQQSNLIVERQWIDLTGQNLEAICHFNGATEDESYKFQLMARSWPSFPAAVFTYACLYISCYLSFIGTARPLRIITCVLVMILLLVATIFNVQLVKEHFHHWEDVVASSVLSLIVVTFVLMVYLNKFRDTHYYQNQKLFHSNKVFVNENSRGYTNEMASGQYNLDKTTGGGGGGAMGGGSSMQNGDSAPVGPLSNDLAMRYFQIPRANYRGGPRPVSSMNQMR